MFAQTQPAWRLFYCCFAMIRHNFILLHYIKKWRTKATKQNEITANTKLSAECGSTYSNSQISLHIQLSHKPILILPTLWVLIQTKGQQHKLHTQYSWKEWKGCESYKDNPKYLHSEWGLKKFKEVQQLWLPKSHWIWNESTSHSTIPVNTSKFSHPHMRQKPYDLHNRNYYC